MLPFQFCTTKLLLQNFQGHELRVVTLVYEPFSCYDKSTDGTITPSDNCVDNNMLAALANTLNFTYDFVEPEDGQWGHRQENGSYTGESLIILVY